MPGSVLGELIGHKFQSLDENVATLCLKFGALHQDSTVNTALCMLHGGDREAHEFVALGGLKAFLNALLQ